VTPFRILVAVGVAAILAGTSYGLRPLDVEAVEPAAVRESTAELLEAAVRGCAEAGGLSSTGILDGVVVARCTPAALPHLGVGPAVAVRR
jgi:hypothetical protein